MMDDGSWAGKVDSKLIANFKAVFQGGGKLWSSYY